MIKIKVTEKNISILGHAKYDEYGKDIVCASVSSIVMCSVEAIANFDTDAIDIKQSKDKLDIIINKEYNFLYILYLLCFLPTAELLCRRPVKIYQSVSPSDKPISYF